MAYSERILNLFLLLVLVQDVSSIIASSSISSSLLFPAIIGDNVTIDCTLFNTGLFAAAKTNYIVGTDEHIFPFVINGNNGFVGVVHLSRLSTTPRDPIAGMVLIGDLTITQVLPSDDSLVLGCIAPTLNGGNKMQTITLEVIIPEPENFMGTALNSTSILLTWDGRQSNGFITEYEVIKTASLFEPNDEIFNVIVAVTMLTGISLEVINLEEGFEYNFDISAKYDSFFSTTSTTTVFTDEIAPSGTVQNLILDATTIGEVVVNFDPPYELEQNGLITSYVIQYIRVSNYSSSEETFPASTTDNPTTYRESYTIFFLDSFTEYIFNVSAINSIGRGPFTSLLAMTLPDPPTSPPININTQVTGPTSIQITWDPPLFVNRNGPIVIYTVQYSGDPFDPMSVSDIVDAPLDQEARVSHVVLNLVEFNNYSFIIRVANEGGNSIFSDPIIGMTNPDGPATSPFISLMSSSPTEILAEIEPLSGANQNGVITGYIVSYFGTPFNTTPQVIVVPVPASRIAYPLVTNVQFAISGLEEYNNYIFRVRASNNIGDGPESSPFEVFTLIGEPALPPRNLTATANATTLFLSWYPPVNESQNGLIILYDFNISSTPFGPSIEFESYSVSSGYPAVETLMVAFGQREEFNNYTISVSAVTSAGNGPYSTDVRIRTEQAAPSSPPTNVTVNALSTTINVTWNAPDGIDQNGIIMRFNVSYRGSPFDTALQSVIVGVNPVEYPLNRMFQVSLNTLEEFNVYYINVLAINQIGEGPTSPISSVRTTQSICGRPSLVGSNVLNATTIQVSWRAPIEAEQNGPIESYIVTFSSISIQPPIDNRIVQTDLTYPASINTLYSVNFTDIEEGISYNITVRAVNGAGVGPISSTIREEMTPVVSPPNIIPFPRNISNIEFVATTTLGLIFPDISEEFLGGPLTGFTIYYQGFLTIASLFSPVRSRRSINNIFVTETATIVTGPVNQYILTGLLPNFEYVVNISANNILGSTAAVQLPSVLQNSDVPGGSAINIQAVPNSPYQITYTWDNDLTTINGILQSYSLYYTESGLSPVLISSPVNTTGPYTYVLSNLNANTEYSLTFAVVNDVGEGPNSTSILATTYPAIPEASIHVIPTISTVVEVLQRFTINVPSQNSFTTANIAVIYIISDTSDPPIFTTLTLIQAYSIITTSLYEVIRVNGNPSIRIQAILNETYYNKSGNYFQFTVGDGIETTYNGDVYINEPLLPDSSYEFSYYILFFNEDGSIIPQFALIDGSAKLVTSGPSSKTICVECIVVPLLIISLIMLIVIVIIIIISTVFWHKRNKAVKNSSNPRNAPVESIVITKIERESTHKDEGVIYSNVIQKNSDIW